MTLVALIAVTTGAWADETPLVTINASSDFKSGSKTFDNKVTATFSQGVAFSDGKGWFAYSAGNKTLTVEPVDGVTITRVKFYTTLGNEEVTAAPFEASMSQTYVYVSGGSGSTTSQLRYHVSVNGIMIGDEKSFNYLQKIEVYGTAEPPIEVAWDATTKTGTFTMPGGNVTLEPEYYPQATVADGGVTAADADARATTDDPLVKVDATKLTGAKKLMYFVSNSGTAPAYDAEGWTDQLPTAKGLTQQGIVYVWYYPVGIDEGVDGATATYSDGDICLQSITARIAAEPTYAVTFAEGTPETDKWTADPNAGVTKGETVTVTYTGTKKVIGVKAEKKGGAAGPITVTWNGADITGSGNSFTKDGVTITAGDIDFSYKDFIGGGTFTTTLGNFTKIEVTTGYWSASGTGWSASASMQSATWTGTPASSVSFSDEIMGMGMGNTKFVFTIEPTN